MRVSGTFYRRTLAERPGQDAQKHVDGIIVGAIDQLQCSSAGMGAVALVNVQSEKRIGLTAIRLLTGFRAWNRDRRGSLFLHLEEDCDARLRNDCKRTSHQSASPFLRPIVTSFIAALLVLFGSVTLVNEAIPQDSSPARHSGNSCEDRELYGSVEGVRRVDATNASYRQFQPDQWDILERDLGAGEYTIGRDVVPRFTLITTPSHARSESPWFSVGAELQRARRCPSLDDNQRLISLLVSTYSERADEYELLPVTDWAADAGPEAVEALADLEAACRSLTPYQALAEFGVPMRLTPDGGIEIRFDQEDSCYFATRSYAYAIRVRGPEADFVVSNIFGDVFVEGVE